MDYLRRDLRGRTKLMVGRDFYAWAEGWCTPSINDWGRIIIEVVASLDIVLHNQGFQHTFNRAGPGSIIYLTFVSSSIARSWRVGDVYTAGRGKVYRESADEAANKMAARLQKGCDLSMVSSERHSANTIRRYTDVPRKS